MLKMLIALMYEVQWRVDWWQSANIYQVSMLEESKKHRHYKIHG